MRDHRLEIITVTHTLTVRACLHWQYIGCFSQVFPRFFHFFRGLVGFKSSLLVGIVRSGLLSLGVVLYDFNSKGLFCIIWLSFRRISGVIDKIKHTLLYSTALSCTILYCTVQPATLLYCLCCDARRQTISFTFHFLLLFLPLFLPIFLRLPLLLLLPLLLNWLVFSSCGVLWYDDMTAAERRALWPTKSLGALNGLLNSVNTTNRSFLRSENKKKMFLTLSILYYANKLNQTKSNQIR